MLSALFTTVLTVPSVKNCDDSGILAPQIGKLACHSRWISAEDRKLLGQRQRLTAHSITGNMSFICVLVSLASCPSVPLGVLWMCTQVDAVFTPSEHI